MAALNADAEPRPAVTLTITVHAQEPLPGEDPMAYVDYLVECATEGLRERIIEGFRHMAEGGRK